MAANKELSGFSHLLYFTLISLLINADRGVMSGLVGVAQEEFEVGTMQGGFLGSGFVGGLMFFAPIAASAKPGPSITLTIGLGLALWTVSVLAAGLAPNYPVLLAGRIAAGAGEAGYAALAPAIVDDTAPPGKRALYVALYYASILMGTALGFVIQAPWSTWATGRWVFVVEGFFMIPFMLFILCFGHRFHRGDPEDDEEETTAVGDIEPNRRSTVRPRKSVAFRIVSQMSRGNLVTIGVDDEAVGLAPIAPRSKSVRARTSSSESNEDIAAAKTGPSRKTAPGVLDTTTRAARSSDPGVATQSAPLAAAAALAAEAAASDDEEEEEVSGGEPKGGMLRSACIVFGTPVYTLLVAGYTCAMFAQGGFGFWAPSYIVSLGMGKGTAGAALGVVVAISGFVGSALGGCSLDAMTRRTKLASGGNAHPMLRCATAIRLTTFLGALTPVFGLLCVVIENPFCFLVFLGFTLGLMCMITAPVNIAMMESVPTLHRGMAMALTMTCQHLLGDMFSPALVGKVADATGSLRIAMYLLVVWLCLCPILYASAGIIVECKMGRCGGSRARARGVTFEDSAKVSLQPAGTGS